MLGIGRDQCRQFAVPDGQRHVVHSSGRKQRHFACYAGEAGNRSSGPDAASKDVRKKPQGMHEPWRGAGDSSVPTFQQRRDCNGVGGIVITAKSVKYSDSVSARDRGCKPLPCVRSHLHKRCPPEFLIFE
jgi:hypothetical protein